MGVIGSFVGPCQGLLCGKFVRVLNVVYKQNWSLLGLMKSA